MAIEKDVFVPFISANLGKSLDEVTKQEVKLKDFKPKFEVQYLTLHIVVEATQGVKCKQFSDKNIIFFDW